MEIVRTEVHPSLRPDAVMKLAHALPDGCVLWLLQGRASVGVNDRTDAVYGATFKALRRRNLVSECGHTTVLGMAVQQYLRRQRGLEGL